MSELPVDFLDAILAAGMNGKRRVKLTVVDVGTGIYEVEDATEYDQEGSVYGAAQVNETNRTVNGKIGKDTIVDDLETAAAVTEEGFPAGCLAVGQLNAKAGTFSGPYTIPAGVTSYIISNTSIAESSVVDIYPEAYTDVEALNNAGVSWTQAAGSVTLLFESATAAAINLQYVCVRNIDGNAPAPTPTPTTAEYGSITELETTTFDYSFSGDFAEKTEEG